MAIDIDSLLTDMLAAGKSVISHDLPTLQGFSDSQLKAIALQAAYVAAGVVDGSISGDMKDYFLDSLEEMVRSFVNTLAGLVTVMAEKLWNAIVGVIWSAINRVTGLALFVPPVTSPEG
jgi:hypothetical protein